MVSYLLLIIIYLAYVSLGLPDGLMGIAWPEIRTQFDLPMTAASIMSIIGTVGSTISSFSSGHILKRIGTGKMILFSGLLTGIAIFGFSLSTVFPVMVLFSIPHGIGAGGVDSSLNHFVSKNLTSRHMNWLHAFWGIGASIGPVIMTYAILWTHRWNNGFLIVSMIQLSLAALFFFTLPEWRKIEGKNARPSGLTGEKKESLVKVDSLPVSAEKIDSTSSVPGTPQAGQSFLRRFRDGFLLIFKQHGLFAAMLTFFFYVGAEATIGFWSATYLRFSRDVSLESAGL